MGSMTFLTIYSFVGFEQLAVKKTTDIPLLSNVNSLNGNYEYTMLLMITEH